MKSVFFYCRQSLILAFVGLVALAGCGGSSEEAADPELLSFFDTTAKSAETLDAFLSDTTMMVYDAGLGVPAHGTQIEYLASNGKSYLWYPGNTSLVVGDWRVIDDGSNRRWPTQICYRYASSTRNPVLGTSSTPGEWSCRPSGQWLYVKNELVDGDPLRLSSGRLPYVLSASPETTIEQAVAKAGLGTSVGANKITWDWRARPFN